MNKRNIGTRPFFVGLALAAALAAMPGRAQEASMVLRNIDALEKRVAKVEGELARVKKAGAPAPAAAPALSDSTVTALTARVESLAARLQSLESRATKKDAVADSTLHAAAKQGGAAASASPRAESTPVDGEIAELIREVKALTAQLKDAQLKGGAPDAISKAGIAPASKPGSAAPSADKAPKEASASLSLGTLPKLEVKPVLELKGDIQIQSERKLTTQSKRDNLDDFWGRVNFGAEFNGEDIQSKANIRIFPEGFGFEPLTGATFDTAGQGTLKTQTQSQARVVVNHAWVRYALGDYRLKVGRFETVETYSDNFGNYIDLGPSGKFMSRPASHNAFEVYRAAGPLSGSVLLGTNDRKLNRGFLRLLGKYAPSKLLQASLGWRSNAFDGFKYPDDELLQRYDASLLYGGLPMGWKAFVEAALLQQAGGKDDDIPVLVGIQPNAGKVLDLLALEMEWMSTRQVAKEYKEVLFNVHARKAWGRFKVDLGIYSDLNDPDNDAFGAGLRLTSGIK